ncbi:ankyrin repeat-containing domain protein [Aspergillus multicolor]|uniref:ankyrin repeat-containing domain protein n=1 Tax=Aspergillus multicolor TaxID=41759 RepID=UPI003CCDD782
MPSFQSLPQEIVDSIVESYLQKPDLRQKSTRSRSGFESLQLRFLGRTVNAAIEDALPCTYTFKHFAKNTDTSLARLHVFYAARQGLGHTSPLAAAVRSTTEQCSSPTKKHEDDRDGGNKQRLHLFLKVCHIVGEVLRSLVTLRRPTQALTVYVKDNGHRHSKPSDKKDDLDSTTAPMVEAYDGNMSRKRAMLARARRAHTGTGTPVWFIFDMITAAHRGQLDRVRALAEALGPNGRYAITDEEGNTLLHCAAMSGNAALFEYCLRHSALTPSDTNKVGSTAIALAAGLGQVTIVEDKVFVLDKLQTDEGEYVLALILANGHYDLFRHVMKLQVFSGGFDRKLVLASLVKYGEPTIMRALTKGKTRLLDIPEGLFWEEVLFDAKNEFPDASILSLLASFNITIKHIIGRLLPGLNAFRELADHGTPLARLQLFLAVQNGSADEHILATAIREASELILQAKGNQAPSERERDNTWKTVCSAVLEAFRPKALSVHLGNRSKDSAWMPNLALQTENERHRFHTATALVATAYDGDVSLLRALINRSPQAGTGSAAEHVYELVILTAARRGNFEMLRALLKVHNVDARSDSALDRHGNNIKHCAAASGGADLFMYCFEHFKCSAWKQNKRRQTAMDLAASLGHADRAMWASAIKSMMNAAAAGGQTAVFEYLKRYTD